MELQPEEDSSFFAGKMTKVLHLRKADLAEASLLSFKFINSKVRVTASSKIYHWGAMKTELGMRLNWLIEVNPYTNVNTERSKQ